MYLCNGCGVSEEDVKGRQHGIWCWRQMTKLIQSSCWVRIIPTTHHDGISKHVWDRYRLAHTTSVIKKIEMFLQSLQYFDIFIEHSSASRWLYWVFPSVDTPHTKHYAVFIGGSKLLILNNMQYFLGIDIYLYLSNRALILGSTGPYQVKTTSTILSVYHYLYYTWRTLETIPSACNSGGDIYFV